MSWQPGFSVPFPDEPVEEGGGGGEGAPTDARYLVTQADSSLSNEVVVGTTPQGEVGGAWSNITVDADHGGSTHAAIQAAAEATAAADATTKANSAASGAAAALSSHEADTTSVHGISNTASLETTSGAQTKVDTHVNDTSAAHAASAIAFTPAGNLVATDAQTAVAEAATDAATALSTHDSDTSNVHGITDTSVLETTTGAQTKADAKVSDTAYASSWNAVTTVAPSKNAVWDEMETRRRTIGLRAGVTVVSNNTADQTLLASTITPAANTFAALDIVTFHAQGSLFNDTAGGQTFQFELKVGANVLWDSTALNVADMATGVFRSWSINATWRCTSAGSGSYREGFVTVRIGPVTGGTSQLFDFDLPVVTTAENFASPAAIDLVVTQSANSINLSTTCNSASLERLRTV